MQTTIPVSQTELTRQERLKLWFWKVNRTQADIAREVGVTKSTMTKWMRAERLSTWRWQMLRDTGIPEELLPSAQDMPGGPKPR